MQQFYSAVIILTCATLGILGVLVHENSRLDKKSKRKFYWTYAVIAFAAISEWAGVALNGAPEWTRLLHVLVKFLDYSLTPLAGLCFALQVSKPGRRQRYIWPAIGMNVLFQMISIFAGWTFYLDEANVYHHGPLYAVYIVVYLLTLSVVVYEFAQYGRNYPKQNRNSLYLSSLLITGGIVIQEIFGIRVSYLVMAICSTLLFIHFSEFSQLQSDFDLSNKEKQLDTDALTGLYSRYAFNNELNRYENLVTLPEDLVVVSIDINGLKTTNDNLGHLAGDELIQGAARCISVAMAKYGKCFRTGGDEFICFLHIGKDRLEAIKDHLDAEAAAWKGQHVQALRLAAGECCSTDYPDMPIEKLVSIADQAMYAEKRSYYQQDGRDRRRR